MLASLPLCSQECVCIWEGAFVVARVRPSTRGCVCVFKRVRLFARVCCGAAVLERVRLFVRVYLLLRGCVSACKDVFVRVHLCMRGCI